jgi:hypothetical protein
MLKNNRISLEEHISQTYFDLRRGIGILAIALPIILAVVGFAQYGLILQDSLSAYYHAFVATPQSPDLHAIAGNGVMRNWFVGILWAVGVFLILYKGYGHRENTALNIAGVLLIMVSMFPMDWICKSDCPKISIHGISAILFFFSIGYVCIFRSGDTLALVSNPKDQQLYKRYYTIIGWAMFAFPVIVTTLEFFQLHPFGTRTVFIVEVGGIWIFAVYWLLKSREISVNNIDRKINKGKVDRPARQPNIFKYWLDTTPLQDKESTQ